MDRNKEEILELWENRETIRVSAEYYDELQEAVEHRQARFVEALFKNGVVPPRLDCFTGQPLPTPHCHPDTFRDCPCDDMCDTCTEYFIPE